MRSGHVFLTSCLFTLVGCGEPAQTPDVPASGGGESAAPVQPSPAKAWADRNFDERGDYMAKVVVPAMKDLFQRFDAARFADFGCVDCHGPNAQEVRFHMPNGLHPLDPRAMPMANAADPEVARWARFMSEEVKPRMTELLGATAFDPTTGQGFGCFGCHAMAPGTVPAP